MAFWVYVLECADGRYYTGHNDDLDLRLSQHYAGESRYTSTHLPLRLVFSELFMDRDTAFWNERRIKSWSRAKERAMFAGDWKEVSRLAVPPGERDERGATLEFMRSEQAFFWDKQWD